MLRLLFLLCATIIETAYARPGDLRSQLYDQGSNISLVLPGESSFASFSRPYNLRFNFKPAAVVFPTSIQDVAQIVRLGGLSKHQVVARSGGHSFIANGMGGKDGVIVVDLRNFKQITVDPKSGTAVIGTGNRLGNIATTLAAHGRALPHGSCPHVGIGGHAAHGGFGFTSRLWGLTLDNILSIDLVMGNGTITTASQTNYPDLFWAMRGAGGSFGIATAITVKTFSVPPSATAFSYQWNLTAAQAAQALGFWQDFVLASNPPLELGALVALVKGSVRGSIGFGLMGGWYGPSAQLNATLAPFFEKMSHSTTQRLHVGNYLHSAAKLAGGSLDTTSSPEGNISFYAKSLMIPQSSPMSPAALKALMNSLANEGSTTPVGWDVLFELFGGGDSVANAVKPDATAFVHRDVLFMTQFYAQAPNSAPPFPQAGFTFIDNLVNSIIQNSPHNWNYGAYTNYVDDRLADWQNRYYGENYPKLRRLKGIYDPNHTFTFPTSIES